MNILIPSVLQNSKCHQAVRFLLTKQSGLKATHLSDFFFSLNLYIHLPPEQSSVREFIFSNIPEQISSHRPGTFSPQHFFFQKEHHLLLVHCRELTIMAYLILTLTAKGCTALMR